MAGSAQQMSALTDTPISQTCIKVTVEVINSRFRCKADESNYFAGKSRALTLVCSKSLFRHLVIFPAVYVLGKKGQFTLLQFFIFFTVSDLCSAPFNFSPRPNVRCYIVTKLRDTL